MRLFDTSTKAYVEFVSKPEVGMYVCGVTPYDAAHMGHIFTFMTYDLLQRRLEDMGSNVKMVRNIIDVDEPIYVKARKLGLDYRELALRETGVFDEVMKQLNFREPFAEPKASEYIEPMAAAVRKLLDKGFAYHVDKDIYYDTSKDPDYGGFSGYPRALLIKLLTERGGDPERPGKRNPLDFLLWRAVTDPKDPAQWQTIVGTGRPGWHIECSVMSNTLLGEQFDIHGGGVDLIFPHHESEIAQSYGLTGKMPAKIWPHVSPLLYAGEKMSKSLGNLVFVKDLLQNYSPDVIRLSLMYYHHRIGGEWQNDLPEKAAKLWKDFQAAAHTTTSEQAEKFLQDIRTALDDDLNTPAIISIFTRFTEGSRLTIPNKSIAPAINTALNLLGLTSLAFKV